MEEQSIYTEKKKLRQFINSNREKIKRILKSRFGVVCWYCGVKENEYQIDHIIAVTNGGTNELKNLALVCKFCNAMKWGYDIEEFYAWQNHLRSEKFKRYYNHDSVHPLSSLYECKAEENH